MIQGREYDGFPEFQENFLRRVLRKFPYDGSTLAYYMIKELANTNVVSIPVDVFSLGGLGVGCIVWYLKLSCMLLQILPSSQLDKYKENIHDGNIITNWDIYQMISKNEMHLKKDITTFMQGMIHVWVQMRANSFMRLLRVDWFECIYVVFDRETIQLHCF